MIPNPCETVLQDTSFSLPARLSFTGAAYPELIAHMQLYWQKLLCIQDFNTTDGCLEIHLHTFPKLAASHKDMHMLLVQPNRITLSAKSEAGFRYALQSLLQLLYIAIIKHNGILQCQSIVDYPLFEWRGLHLDESRHFFGMDTVKHLLRCMAALKLNKFHWHLSDDQGWRIESKLFPRLTEIGAWRKEADGSSYGGYYTQVEIRSIIAYAGTLGIEVIPEIDLPGHTLALLAAYPELACNPASFTPSNQWGIFDDILCAGKNSVMDFLSKLLSEMAELFTGQYFHLGGDEAPKQNWKRCPHCQARIKSEGLDNEEELQSWMIKQLCIVLAKHDKTVIGWDEILDGNIGKEPVVMVWRGDGHEAADKASQLGNRFILCPNTICYFDWKQSTESPGAHGVSTLANVYGFSPNTYGNSNLCMGGQANLWTEHIHNKTELFYMLSPRIYALSEVLWNPAKDFPSFTTRLTELEGYFETLS